MEKSRCRCTLWFFKCLSLNSDSRIFLKWLIWAIFYMQVVINCLNNVHMYANKFVVYTKFLKIINVLCANIISFYFCSFTSTLSLFSSKTMFNHFTISVITIKCTLSMVYQDSQSLDRAYYWSLKVTANLKTYLLKCLI